MLHFVMYILYLSELMYNLVKQTIFTIISILINSLRFLISTLYGKPKENQILQTLLNFKPSIFKNEYNIDMDSYELAEKANQLLRNNTSFRSTNALAKFYELYPKDCFEIDKMVNLVVISVFLHDLDDCIEESRDNGLRWLDLLDGKICSNNTPIEILYDQHIRRFLATLSYFQRSRVEESIKIFVLCSLREHDEFDTLLNMKREEYLKFRVDNNLVGFQIFELEYGLNMSIEEKIFNSPLLKSLWTHFGDYVSICQDLYSFKKEVGEKGAELNYLYFVMKDMNCDIHRAIKESIKVLNDLEKKIDYNLKRIIESNIGFDNNFILGVSNFIHATLDYLKLAPRYNSLK